MDHLRSGSEQLQQLLEEGEVACHPIIVGELACGNLKNRGGILSLLQELPVASVADDEEVLHLVERHTLMGKGIGYIDAHLLASALLSRIPLLTLDKRLHDLSVALLPPH